MNSNLILKSDMLDIIFDNRNKTYGAYVLRKFYPDRIIKSLAIMIVFVAVVTTLTFISNNKVANPVFVFTDGHILHELQIEKKKQINILDRGSKKLASQKFIKKMILVSEKDSSEILKNISDIKIESSTTIFTGTLPSSKGFDGNKKLPVNTEETIVVNSVPTDNPTVQATYPGGNVALIEYLQRNLRTPKDIEEGNLVLVKIKFVVGFDGNLQSFTVVQDGGEEFNNEVLRVLMKMPKWNPGKMGTQAVPVYYTIPVKFSAIE